MNIRNLSFVIACHFLMLLSIQAKSLDNEDFLKTNTIETGTDDEDVLFREQYAKKMISYMNQGVDPCDDFYEYACGNWKNAIENRHTHKRRNNLFEINFNLADMVENLLQNPDEKLNFKYGEEIQKVQTFYKSCLQADLMPVTKSKEYLKVIKNISGFPAIDENWKADEFDWFNATAHYSVYGVESFVKEEVIPIYPFPPIFKLPDLGLDMFVHSDNIRTNGSRGYIINEKRIRQYLTAYGVTEPKVSEVIENIFELWHAILNVTDEFQENKDKCVEMGEEKYNITENNWPKWTNYYEIVWNNVFEEDFRDCPCAYFYMKLDDICQERKEAVANYLAMKFLYHLDARLEDKELKKDFCNQKVMASFKYLIDELYMVDRNLNDEKREINIITQQIRAIFREKLKELQWLDEPTRKEALLKESGIKLSVGRVEAAELMEKIIKETQKIQINNSNYEENNLETVKFQAYMERYFGLNLKHFDEDTVPSVFLTGMQVQALFYQLDLMIFIMAGVLYPPAYHKSWPWAVKYGTLGYAIGHELTHAFDTTGADINSEGIPISWWTGESFSTFENLTRCFIEKFNGYEITEIHRKIDGNNTKDENIADHGGLRYAFMAYQRHIKELKAENDPKDILLPKSERMPGLDLKPEQLFYLSFAQVMCADYKEENIWQLLDDDHVHDKYRVLGVLSNMPEFAEAYKCPAGSKMNSMDKKCKLW